MVKDYTKEYNKKHCLFSLHYSHCEYFSKNRARQTIVGRWPPCPVLPRPNCLNNITNLVAGGRGTETTVLLWFAIEQLIQS